jgi:integrase
MLQVRGTLRRTREGLTFGVPTTAASRRQVVLSPSLVAALWRHRARQEEERQGVRDPWLNLGLVFPTITFHALRHTAETLLLSEGEHPKVVQELLGHAQVSVTLDRYSHMTPRLISNAAAVMDRLLDEEA